MGPSSQSSFYTHLCPPAAFLRPRRDRPSPQSAEPDFTDTGKIGKTASGRNCLSPMQLSAPPCRAETTSRHVRSDRVCVELLFGLIWHEFFFGTNRYDGSKHGPASSNSRGFFCLARTSGPEGVRKPQLAAPWRAGVYPPFKKL